MFCNMILLFEFDGFFSFILFFWGISNLSDMWWILIKRDSNNWKFMMKKSFLIKFHEVDGRIGIFLGTIWDWNDEVLSGIILIAFKWNSMVIFDFFFNESFPHYNHCNSLFSVYNFENRSRTLKFILQLKLQQNGHKSLIRYIYG